VLVTHNMQQAARASDYTAFLLNGDLIELGETNQIFTNPVAARPRNNHGAVRLGEVLDGEHTSATHQPAIRRGAAQSAHPSAPDGGLVERQIANAIDSWSNATPNWPPQTIVRDTEVNRMDIDIDALCIRLLALRQPAASDLRFITTGLKITTDLERIGDMAVNICERALELNHEPMLKPYIDIRGWRRWRNRWSRTASMRFVNNDTDLAEQVIARDDEVDQLNYQIFRELLSYMAEEPRTIGRATRVLFVSKYLERIADHATNIADGWWSSWSRARPSNIWTRTRNEPPATR